jgi:hypothetical protein
MTILANIAIMWAKACGHDGSEESLKEVLDKMPPISEIVHGRWQPVEKATPIKVRMD